MKDDIYQESLKLHEKTKGKLEITPKMPLRNKHDLSLAYTPGVAEACRQIAKDKNLAYKYTIKSNTVAIVSDGSAVLGLGNIGGVAAIPVMEGKALLFKEFANIDAFPICFEDYHLDFAEDVKNISPVFGGINLEDIAAPKCFELEDQLQDIGIPVFHDDQHGTAIVVLAALINACKVTGKNIEEIKVVINGAGAAGFAIMRLLRCLDINPNICRRVKDIVMCDTKGIIHKNREKLLDNKYKYIIANETNKDNISGELVDALKDADVFVGVSAPDVLTEDMIKVMKKDPIVFALANPVPEIMPDKALNAGAAVVATGRSDFPNQVNNVLAFPGIFRGALDARAKTISNEMKIAAAYALANYVKDATKEMIIPDPLDKEVAKVIAKAVMEACTTCNCREC